MARPLPDEGFLRSRLDGAVRAVSSIADHLPTVAAMSRDLAGAIDGGGRVLTCGNGGSAAEAMHLAEELIGRYRASRPSYAAVCLNADPTALTCIANDFGFDQVFARQVEGLGRRGDVLVVFSTSGNSRNISLALDAARARGVRTIALLGRDGGDAAGRADLSLIVPSDDTAHIQEAHQVVLHMLLEAFEPR